MRKENEKNKKEKCMLLLMGAIVFFASSFTTACASNKNSSPKRSVQTDEQGVEYLLSESADEYMVVGAKKGRTEIVVPANFLGLPVTAIGKEAFVEHDDLKKITIEYGVLTIGEAAFYGCDDLETLSLPNSLKSIGYYAFDECESLSYFEKDGVYYLGNEQNPFVYLSHSEQGVERVGVAEGCVLVEAYAFKNRENLTAVFFPEGVSFLGRQLFEDCRNLSQVELPQSLSYIDSYAFSRCVKLTSLNYLGTEEEWGKVERIWDWRYECHIRKIICADGEVWL